MKKIIMAWLLSTALTGWAVDIPTRADEWRKQSIIQSSKLVQTPEIKILAHYDAQGRVMKSPTAGGFYRALLGYTAEGLPVVQDYYQDSRSKQIDPVVIAHRADVNRFDATASQGITTWYTPNGEVREFIVLNHGIITQRGVYDENGALLMTKQTQNNGAWSMLFFYPNGKKMLEIHQNDEGTQRSLSFDEKGKVIFDSARNVVNGKNSDLRAVQVEQIKQRANAILQRVGM